MTNNGSKFNGNNRKLSNVKIANEVIFYGEKNCITCSYILPLINYGIKNDWFSNYSFSIFKTKKEYNDKVAVVLKEYNITYISAPVVEMITFENKKGLVNPQIVATCAHEIMDRFKVLGEDAFLDYIEDALELDLFFANQVLNMATNIIYMEDD